MMESMAARSARRRSRESKKTSLVLLKSVNLPFLSRLRSSLWQAFSIMFATLEGHLFLVSSYSRLQAWMSLPCYR